MRESKNKSWKEYDDILKKNGKENQKLFYKVLKTLRKGITERITTIKSKGAILTNTNDIRTIEAQSDFRKKRNVQSHIFTLKQLLSHALQRNKQMFVAFMD